MNKVKGTYDVLPNESKMWQALEKKIAQLMERYNYKEIRTPMMEYSEVFHRQSEGSDMVTKETYDFLDRSDRKLTLKPEGTAGVIRSFVENKLYVGNDVVKLYYIQPNFRYERPQKGRYRQFMQFGVEAIGIRSPLLDAEVVSIAYNFIKILGLKGAKIKINTLGDKTSRTNYLEALKAYFEPHREVLSYDSKVRLDKNPLRILDSKDENDIKLVKDAPTPLEYLTDDAKNYFDDVLKYLDSANIDYEISPRLVRGLDYYSHVVFEVEADIEGFGAQNVLGGGGRYESLVEELGGPSLGGIGIAFGLERILLALEAEHINLASEDAIDAYFIVFDEAHKKHAFSYAEMLRANDISVEFDFKKTSFKNQLKRALKLNAKYLLILGEDEINQGTITVKNTVTETQESIKQNDLLTYLKEKLGE